MATVTPNSEQPSKRQGDYNPLEYNAEYKLLYLQDLVARGTYTAITEFLAKQSEYETANLIESFPTQDRQII